MTIQVDERTALRAILKLFDALGPDGQAAGDVDRVEIMFSCSTAGQPDRLTLFERPTWHGRPVVSKAAAAQMRCPFGPDPNL